MKIDRTNYEEYFLDFLEGRLPAEQIAELLVFAHANPDLKALIDDEEWIRLEPDETISFVPKSALKRPDIAAAPEGLKFTPGASGEIRDMNNLVSLDNYEEIMIRYYDRSLSEEEKAGLAHFLMKYPAYIREFEIFGNTFLKAEQDVVYHRKSELKRRVIGIWSIKRTVAVVSVAASLLLFSTLFLKYEHLPELKENRYSKLETASNASSRTKAPSAISGNHKDNTQTVYPSVKINRHPASPEKPALVKERIPMAPLASMDLRPANEIASTGKPLLASIRENNDFDGVTYLSYIDREGPANTMTSGSTSGGSRLASTLAKGISQTAGSLARGSEIGRLLRGSISLVDIADLGLAGYNLISSRDLSLQRDYDENGQPKGYSLKDGDRRLTRLP